MELCGFVEAFVSVLVVACGCLEFEYGDFDEMVEVVNVVLVVDACFGLVYFFLVNVVIECGNALFEVFCVVVMGVMLLSEVLGCLVLWFGCGEEVCILVRCYFEVVLNGYDVFDVRCVVVRCC